MEGESPTLSCDEIYAHSMTKIKFNLGSNLMITSNNLFGTDLDNVISFSGHNTSVFLVFTT